MNIHILPINDFKEHEELTTCKCLPSVDFNKNGDMIIIHNSFDGREKNEGFNKVVDVFKK